MLCQTAIQETPYQPVVIDPGHLPKEIIEHVISRLLERNPSNVAIVESTTSFLDMSDKALFHNPKTNLGFLETGLMFLLGELHLRI